MYGTVIKTTERTIEHGNGRVHSLLDKNGPEALPIFFDKSSVSLRVLRGVVAEVVHHFEPNTVVGQKRADPFEYRRRTPYFNLGNM